MHPIARRLAPVLLLAAGAPLAACDSLHSAAGVSAGFVSHQLCSGVFVSGQDPELYYRQAIAPTASVVAPLISHKLDLDRREASASFAGLVTRTAAYHPGLGCGLVRGAPPAAVAAPPPAPALLPPIAGPDVVEPQDSRLRAALDRAFAETDHAPHRWTKAVVIVHDGQVIAERYAPGYGVDTPILGWSMTKSVTNALIGVLVRQGRLSLDGPAPVAAWSAPGDPRHAISIDALMRMTSGLDIGQSLDASLGTAFDPTGRMVFDETDMAGFAERARLGAAPGTSWTYTNGDTLLLSRMIRDQAGGDAAHVVAFAHRELFDKLGMTQVTLEFDGVGTPIGASHMWASARDWARFGMLYLDDGVVGGERILPQGWADYSARLTPGSETYGYGAGFWTNRGDSAGARIRTAGGMPADAFMARGNEGQYVVIVPSARLVIVRLGMAYTPREDMPAVARLTADAVAAVAGGDSSRAATQTMAYGQIQSRPRH
jgi:hypothetical protein